MSQIINRNYLEINSIKDLNESNPPNLDCSINLVKPSEEVEELKWVDSNFDRDKLTVTGIMILEDLKEKNIIY